jgi:hypothetical protein
MNAHQDYTDGGMTGNTKHKQKAMVCSRIFTSLDHKRIQAWGLKAAFLLRQRAQSRRMCGAVRSKDREHLCSRTRLQREIMDY